MTDESVTIQTSKGAALANLYENLYLRWLRSIGTPPATQQECDQISNAAIVTAEYIAATSTDYALEDLTALFDELHGHHFDAALCCNMILIVTALAERQKSHYLKGWN